jgi:hypothetical protein
MTRQELEHSPAMNDVSKRKLAEIRPTTASDITARQKAESANHIEGGGTLAPDEKSLSKWDETIRQARLRVAELKRSIRLFEELRDIGMDFPEPKRKQRKSKRANTAGALGNTHSRVGKWGKP